MFFLMLHCSWEYSTMGTWRLFGSLGSLNEETYNFFTVLFNFVWNGLISHHRTSCGLIKNFGLLPIWPVRSTKQLFPASRCWTQNKLMLKMLRFCTFFFLHDFSRAHSHCVIEDFNWLWFTIIVVQFLQMFQKYTNCYSILTLTYSQQMYSQK